MLATTNGEVNANPSALIATHDPPVGRHWPTASPPMNGEEGGGLNPSVARQESTVCATSIPQAMPRSRDSPPSPPSSLERCE